MMCRRDGSIRLEFFIAFFFVGFVYCMAAGFVSSAQSLEMLQQNVYTTREMAIASAGKIGTLEARVDKNSEDIRALTLSNTELVASVNRFTGIGIGLGAIGGLIVILQAINLIRSKE